MDCVSFVFCYFLIIFYYFLFYFIIFHLSLFGDDIRTRWLFTHSHLTGIVFLQTADQVDNIAVVVIELVSRAIQAHHDRAAGWSVGSGISDRANVSW